MSKYLLDYQHNLGYTCLLYTIVIGYMETQYFMLSNGHYGATGDLGGISWYSDVNFV